MWVGQSGAGVPICVQTRAPRRVEGRIGSGAVELELELDLAREQKQVLAGRAGCCASRAQLRPSSA